uniref:TIL domain-containing protein n=1 Tax=Anopheles funestus TaxID=62324 RepID=A0A182S3U2_ANOFN
MHQNFIVLLFVFSTLMCVHAQRTSDLAETEAPVCKKGEEYKQCGSACMEDSCGSKKPICKLLCTPGCYCAAGYARNTSNKLCVPKNMCQYINYTG